MPLLQQVIYMMIDYEEGFRKIVFEAEVPNF